MSSLQMLCKAHCWFMNKNSSTGIMKRSRQSRLLMKKNIVQEDMDEYRIENVEAGEEADKHLTKPQLNVTSVILLDTINMNVQDGRKGPTIKNMMSQRNYC